MECQEAKAKIHPYLDQELSLQEEEALFNHLSVCTDCGMEFNTVEETHYLLQKVLVPVVPPIDLTEKIMAQIPFPEKNQEEYIQGGFNWKQTVAGLGKRWRDNWSSRQWKTAAVAMGLMAVFAFGSISNMWEMETLKKQPPDIAHVDNGAKEDQEPEENNTPVVTPPPVPEDPSPEGGQQADEETTPVENSPAETGGNGSLDVSEEDKKPTKVVPDSNTNVVELPQAASGEDRIETIEVAALIKGSGQNMTHPVLTEDGRFVNYLYDNAGVEEEWRIELKSGAAPQKAENNVIIENESSGTAGGQIPQWLSDMEMMKEAKSKSVAWTVDKKQLAVNLNAAGTDNDGIWIARSDGGNIAHVAQESGGNVLVWSPNQMKIAFTDGAGSLYVLYLMENLLIQVMDSSNGLVDIKHLSWTPDGQEIIFEGKNAVDGIAGIYRVALP